MDEEYGYLVSEDLLLCAQTAATVFFLFYATYCVDSDSDPIVKYVLMGSSLVGTVAILINCCKNKKAKEAALAEKKAKEAALAEEKEAKEAALAAEKEAKEKLEKERHEELIAAIKALNPSTSSFSG